MFLFLSRIPGVELQNFVTKFILHLQAFEDEMQNLMQGGGPVRASGAAETSSRKVPIRRLKSPRKSSVTSAPAGMSYFVIMKSWSTHSPASRLNVMSLPVDRVFQARYHETFAYAWVVYCGKTHAFYRYTQ